MQLQHIELGEHNWLVVSTPLKNISQLGSLFPIYGKIKKCSKPPTRTLSSLHFIFKQSKTNAKLTVWYAKWLKHAEKAP